MTDLGVLAGWTTSAAFGVNASGQVVGACLFPGTFGDIQGEAFIWDQMNGMRDLNPLLPFGSGWQLDWAGAINDKGQIVARGTQTNGNIHYALLLTPQ